tara:strand:+ start:3031 stop:3780 length:750 start_codon:yes stop_codon:yes gene_type:complete
MNGKDIKAMVDKYPNNMELGKKVRQKIWDEEKQWKIDQFNRNRAPEDQVSTTEEMEEQVRSIFESPDGGKTVYKRKFNDYSSREKMDQMSLFGEGEMEIAESTPQQLELFPEVVKKLVSWDEYEIMIDKLAVWVKYCMEEEVGAIYGLPRGGLPVAVSLSHRTGLPLLMNYADKKIVAKGKKVLVVDDIADTGHTLMDFDNPSNVVVTLHYHKQSKVIPDFYVEEKGNDWIVYPWELEEDDSVQDYLKS